MGVGRLQPGRYHQTIFKAHAEKMYHYRSEPPYGALLDPPVEPSLQLYLCKPADLYPGYGAYGGKLFHCSYSDGDEYCLFCGYRKYGGVSWDMIGGLTTGDVLIESLVAGGCISP
jgi:hypothetical protein